MTKTLPLEVAARREHNGNSTEGFKSRRLPRVLPQPLVRENTPAMPFPLEALGPTLEKAARAIYDKVQAPPAICAQSVLGVATLAAQTHADVLLPTGQTRPLSCYFVTVAASGERKSSADNEALWAIRKHEATLREQYDLSHQEWIIDRDIWEVEKRNILANKKLSRGQKANKLKELGPSPESPLSPYLIFDEPTAEGLIKLLIDNHPSVGVFAAEGAAFVGGHAMTEEKKLNTAAVLSNFWDGQTIKRIRAGDQAQALIGRRLSVHLMMQEDVALRFLGDPVLTDQVY